MSSSRQQEDTLRLVAESLSYIPGCPNELLNQIKSKAESFDTALCDRYMRKFITQLMSKLPPLHSAVSWKQNMVHTLSKFKEIENEKKELRLIFKMIAGVEGVYPSCLRERALPDIKDTVEKIDNKSFGVDPFRYSEDQVLLEKELLTYQGQCTWASFSKVKVECGNVDSADPAKRKMIFSLTSLQLLIEMQERGADPEQMVKIFTDFYKEAAPNVASRINSLQEADMKTILSTLETCIDIEAEISLIEKSLKNIYRDPLDNIKIPGDSFSAKQRMLFSLRSIQVQKETEEDIKERESRINTVTVEFCLELVSQEVRAQIMQIKFRKGARATPLTLQDFYAEVSEMERKNPLWRLKERKTMRAAHHLMPAQVFNAQIDEEDEDNQEEEDEEYPEDLGYYDEEGNWIEFEEDDYSHEDQDEYEEDSEVEPEPTPDGSSCYFTSVKRGAGRGQSFRRGQASRSRGRAAARTPARRGLRQVNQVRGGQKPRFSQGKPRGTGYTAPGRSEPSRPSGQSSRATHCLRCGESSHMAGSCRKFSMYHSEKCPHCVSLNPSGQAIYHPRNLCPYIKDGSSNYRSPRARSPASWQAHGFEVGKFAKQTGLNKEKN